MRVICKYLVVTTIVLAGLSCAEMSPTGGGAGQSDVDADGYTDGDADGDDSFAVDYWGIDEVSLTGS